MKIDYRRGFNPEEMISALKRARKVDADGTVSSSSWGLDDWSLVATSAISRPASVPEQTFRAAVRSALFSKNLKEDFTREDLLRECRQKIGELNRRPSQAYRVVFEVSLRGHGRATFFSGDGWRLLVEPSVRSNFWKQAELARRDEWQAVFHDKQMPGPAGTHRTRVVVVVQAPNPREAHPLARDALDEMRGTMNFVVNETRHSQRSFGATKPINRIRTTTMHSVHLASGAMAMDDFWYERDWIQTEIPDFASDKGVKQKERILQLWMRLRHNKLAPLARTALRQYARALDNDDWRNAFLELWVVLEYLTGVANADYDRLVSRSTAVFENPRLMKEIAQHLRVRRNELVHSSSDDEDAEQLIFQTKRLIQPLLRFYIGNPFHFESIDEVREFLDLPRDRARLLHRRKMIDHALRYRRPASRVRRRNS